MNQQIYKFENVHLAYDEKEILRNLSFSIQKGEFVGILGPNGCGKTTLLKLMAGVLDPNSGSIDLIERRIENYSRRELAKLVSVLPQETTVDFPFTALEVVLMGRAPYLKTFQWEGARDLQIAREAMRLTDCEALAYQDIRSLSGGERERVLIARALAQEPKILLLDEPTTHLDLKHQLEIYRLLKKLHEENGLTLIVVLHDLNFASLSCQRILMLADQELKADGPPGMVLTAERIEEVYGARVFFERSPRDGRFFFLPRLD